ncbi:MAG: SDR family oxidoreductase [Candidatus Tectomicrobia bacterium]|uniref:SDR family oxidoreductase n=1 Tax=Tectimicrobiota bacterium TaxID=2528274 RepID=A0A932MM03_UNCTE|nr:SDR family oxidoreductase [Candidatus Tectomicrobia bacterium]
MNRPASLLGQVAVVSGGTAGIGLAAAERLAGEGARVAMLGRDPERGAAAEERVRRSSPDALFLRADAASREDVQAAFGQITARWPRLDILVNCAGGFTRADPLEGLAEAEWDRIVDWNLKSAYLCAQQAAPTMKKAGYGRIVNVSSVAGREGVLEASLAYSAAKAAMQGLTRRLAAELAPHGVTVNAVAPGVVLSRRAVEVHRHRMEKVLAAIPMGRTAEAEEVADAIWYLASPGASYITGVTIDVNGGRFMC